MLVCLWFVIRQLRSVNPLLDVRLFANRTVSGALTVFLLSAAALGGVYSLFTQYLQQVQGLSPMQAGLSIIPAAAVRSEERRVGKECRGRMSESTEKSA